MAQMIARGIEVERCIDTGDMTKLDGRFYCGIESIYKMTISVMDFGSAASVSVHIPAPCQVQTQELRPTPSIISEPSEIAMIMGPLHLPFHIGS